jgi:hypothetical protein
LRRLAAEEDVGGDVEVVEQVELLVDERDAGCDGVGDAPALGAMTPPRTFISVDLPAPFSPMSPRTSPGATERLTFERATTPG